MRILSILFASAFLLVLLLGVAHAAPYQLTTPFAGFQKGATPGIGEYISDFYVYALSIVGVVALGTIIFWGVVYTLSAGMVTKKQDAIDGITQAVYGLLLLLGAYLILYTINPALVTLREPGVEKLLVAPAITGPTGPDVPPQSGRPSALIYNVTAPEACSNIGGQAFSPCQTYCLATPGLCGTRNVCCGTQP